MMSLALPYFLENARDLEIIGVALGLFFWVQMIRLCFRHEQNSIEKFLWIIFMLVMPPLGALLYFFVRVTKFQG